MSRESAKARYMKRELQENGSERFRTFYTRGLNCEKLVLNFFLLQIIIFRRLFTRRTRPDLMLQSVSVELGGEK